MAIEGIKSVDSEEQGPENEITLTKKGILTGVNDIIFQEGKENQNYSLGKGFNIFVRKNKIGDNFFQYLDENNFESGDIGDDYMVVYFPNGTYSMGMGGIQIFGEYNDDDKPIKPFTASYVNILKVIGDNSEVWQNRDLY